MPVEFFNLENPHRDIFADEIEKGIVLPIKLNQKKHFTIIYPSLAKAIVTVRYKNKEEELNNLISCIKRVPQLASRVLGRNLHIYYYKDTNIIYEKLFGTDNYVDDIFKNKSFLDIGVIKDVEQYIPSKNISDFRKRIKNAITSNFDGYISFLANKVIPAINQPMKYFNTDQEFCKKLISSFYPDYSQTILDHCLKTGIQEISSLVTHIKKNKLKDFLDILLNKLAALKGEYSLYPTCLNKKTDLNYLLSWLEITKDERPLFFNQVVDDFTDPNYKDILVERVIYTFSHNPQFVINFLKFLDDNKISSLPIVENLFSPKYRNEFKQEFFKQDKKDKKKVEEFRKLFIEKYKENPEVIQQFDSLIRI